MGLRKAFAGLVIWLGLMTGAAPGSAGEPEAAIRDVISGQIEAFAADDIDSAFEFASPTIQGMFGTPGNFGRMVRKGYPMVWRPADVRFSRLGERGGLPVQGVLLTDGAGRVHVLDYEMIEVDGVWRINGVRFRDPDGAGA